MPRAPRLLKGLLVAALACGLLGATAPRPVLEANTDDVAPGEVRPGPAVVRTVLKAIPDDIAGLDACVKEAKLAPGDYGSLLREVRIASSPGATLHFVRPAHRPYCWTLYGAHLFRYFLVAERNVAGKPQYRLVFETGGDVFKVFPTVSHGLNDIEATGCTAVECWSARFAFDGAEYRTKQCSHTTFTGPNNSEVTRVVRCES